MSIKQENELRVLFSWRDRSRNAARPMPSSLSNLLALGFQRSHGAQFQLSPIDASLFITAAVDMWSRAVHSFLISAATTQTSPIWSTVTGYYSSHYSIRAVAHALGYFCLFKLKKVAHLELKGGKAYCSLVPKKGGDREHKFYAEAVQQDARFGADPCFSKAKVTPGWVSEIATRDRANYADHLHIYPSFAPLNAEQLLARIRTISNFDITTPPEPPDGKSIDVETIQILAYQRLIRLREHFDTFVSTDSTYWKNHRSPTWASEFINFQAASQGLTALRASSSVGPP